MQTFKKNVILGTDFAKSNQAGVSWTRHGTRVLSVKGLPRLEVEEDELGTPVTTKHHIKVPSRYSAVFEVNLHGSCVGHQNNFCQQTAYGSQPKCLSTRDLAEARREQILSCGRNN